MMKKHYKIILWDWNGTLLNDLVFSIECINIMLKKRSLPLLNVAAYREIFGFPVKTYYEKIGFNFDKEDWNLVAMEFMQLYWHGMHQCELFVDVESTLKALKLQGVKQCVLSAMEHDALVDQIKKRGLDPYFDEVVGINDHYANGKNGKAKQLLNSLNIRREEVLLIGDTLHDFEIAKENRIDALLISRGHQSTTRLLDAQVPVLGMLDNVKAFIKSAHE